MSVTWELRTFECLKGDDSLLTFLLTLKDPHGVPPQKCALRAERRSKPYLAMAADSGCLVSIENTEKLMTRLFQPVNKVMRIMHCVTSKMFATERTLSVLWFS
jgi:hypothetical protein